MEDRKLDVRPWVYRVYEVKENPLVEINAFRLEEDSPYEDIEEGYYIWNTNLNNDPADDADMSSQGKAAAYFEPWKRKVERLSKSDVVLLYRSGTGIIGMGTATGEVKRRSYHDDPAHEGEEFYTKLSGLRSVEPPVSPSEIRELTGIKYYFGTTMFSIDAESGKKLTARINRKQAQ